MKYLVLYVYFERGKNPGEQVDSFNNFKFFISNGILDHDDIDYIIIVNGETITVPLPDLKNVSVVKRSARGNDFAGYAYGLENVDINKYDKFIFLNDSSCGPFLPRYIPEDANWAALFSSRLSDEVKLVGARSSSTSWGWRTWCPHIQSYAFATDRVGLDLLIKKEIFIENGEEIYAGLLKDGGRKEYIKKYEIGMSQVILNEGYKIEPLSLCDIKDLSRDGAHGDSAYFDVTHNPIETIFIKSNQRHRRATHRNTIVQRYREWMSD